MFTDMNYGNHSTNTNVYYSRKSLRTVVMLCLLVWLFCPFVYLFHKGPITAERLVRLISFAAPSGVSHCQTAQQLWLLPTLQRHLWPDHNCSVIFTAIQCSGALQSLCNNSDLMHVCDKVFLTYRRCDRGNG